MVDRLMVWLGTAMVTAGVAAAIIAGAGVAVADTEDGQDANGATSSESAKPTESKADSEAASEKPKPTADPQGRLRETR